MNTAALTIWAIGLVIVVFVVTPVVVTRCLHLIHATGNVRANLQHTLQAAVGVVGNVSHVTALDDTIAAGGALLAVEGRIQDGVAAIDRLFEQRLAAGKGGAQ